MEVTVPPGDDDSGDEAPWGSAANAALGAIDGPRDDISAANVGGKHVASGYFGLARMILVESADLGGVGGYPKVK